VSITHRFGMTLHAKRREIPRMPIHLAGLRRPDDLPFGVGLRDLFTRGDVSRAHPLAGDRVAVANWKQF